MFAAVMLLACIGQCSIDDSATITISVNPPDAVVLVDGVPIEVADGVATLRVPSLACGQRYQYDITARWGSDEQRRRITFARGENVVVAMEKDSRIGTSLADRNAPTAGMIEGDGTYNYGIDRTRLQPTNERFTLDGREISRAEATQLLQARGLEDDSSKLRLTVIGTTADRRQVMEDLRGPLSDIAKECLVQEYPPDHWAVTGAGFYAGGKPTIYLQDADGTVLHRQDDYDDGAAGLRAAYESLRRPNPDYEPDRDRDRRRLGGGVLGRLWELLTHPFRFVLSWILAAALVGLLVVLIMRGWLFFIISWVVSIIPRPPAAPKPVKAKTAKTRAAKAK